MKTYFINKTEMTEQEIKDRYYSIFNNCIEDEEKAQDIYSWAKLNGIKGMIKAIRYFYKTGDEDFYSMIQNV